MRVQSQASPFYRLILPTRHLTLSPSYPLTILPSHHLTLSPSTLDVEMLSLVGLGVAMGNANPPARAAANVVVGTNDDDGVAEAVQSYVLDPHAAS